MRVVEKVVQGVHDRAGDACMLDAMIASDLVNKYSCSSIYTHT
jgi:hypothetical protein